MIVYDIQDLVKIYPGQHTGTGNILANDHINLQIHQGEIFGLLGDNGAGKTTLVRQMANLIPSTSGSIYLYDQPVQNDPMSVALLVGYMPQGGQPLNNLTVGEALYYTAHLRGLSALQARAERNRLTDLWELSPLMNRPNNKLSGGQKRLLQIATAMAGSPPVLILDEPPNDLDPQRRNHVWQVLYGIYFLKISVNIHPLMLLVMPMMAAPLAGLGAWIGVRVHSPEEAGAFSLVATFIMLGLGPVLIPPDKLPAAMQYLGWFSPATYAASALRQVMIGPLSWRFALDLIALLGLTLVILGWVGRKMDWRQE